MLACDWNGHSCSASTTRVVLFDSLHPNSPSGVAFIDEIATAVGADPVAFRLRYLKAPRDIAVVKAAAERAGWQPRPSPRPDHTGDTLVGRGIAYAQRSGAVVAIVAEVEIDRRTGKIWAHKFTPPR